jgi:hypothetical protein
LQSQRHARPEIGPLASDGLIVEATTSLENPMPDARVIKRQTQPILDKLHKKATITKDELTQLQHHIDLLEVAAQGSHHHHHHDS